MTRARRRRPLPGFGLGLGVGMAWFGLVILLPVLALVVRAAALQPAAWLRVIGDARVHAALRLSFGAALAAACTACIVGSLLAWVLVRYAFPGRRLLDALVDLPFALPTAVAGIALTATYSGHGWMGRWLEPLGLKIAYAPAGVVLALVFVGIPFAVRTVQPVLEAMGREQEEAAASLGASRLHGLRRVVLPEAFPAILTGFSLAFARGVGEYGSVIFIAGNLPYRTEILPLLITIRLEEYDYDGAIALSALMLATSFLCLVAINAIPALFSRDEGHAHAA